MELDTIEPYEITPEESAWVDEFVDSSYRLNLHSLKTFCMRNGDLPVPSLEAVKEKMRAMLNPDFMDRIREMENPELELVPVTSGERYLQAMRLARHIDNRFEEEATNWIKKALLRDDAADSRVVSGKITGWELAIVEAPEEVSEPQDSDLILKNRLANFDRTGMDGMTIKQCILLFLQMIFTDRRMDVNSWTICNGSAPYGFQVAGSAWNAILLIEHHIGVQNRAGRIRKVINMGEFTGM